MFDYPRVNSTLTDSVHTGYGVDAYSKMPMEPQSVFRVEPLADAYYTKVPSAIYCEYKMGL